MHHTYIHARRAKPFPPKMQIRQTRRDAICSGGGGKVR